MQRYGFGQYDRFAETDAHLVEGITVKDFLVFQIMKQCFYRSDFALYGFGLEPSVQMRYILFEFDPKIGANQSGML